WPALQSPVEPSSKRTMPHRLLDSGRNTPLTDTSQHRSTVHDEERRAYVATIACLADAVQAKDPYTHGHCERVSVYARAAAERLGLSDNELRVTCYAALLHDVGKIGVSDGVLTSLALSFPRNASLSKHMCALDMICSVASPRCAKSRRPCSIITNDTMATAIPRDSPAMAFRWRRGSWPSSMHTARCSTNEASSSHTH